MRELEEKRREKRESRRRRDRGRKRRESATEEKLDERWIGIWFKIYRWEMFRIKNISGFTVYTVQCTFYTVPNPVQCTLYNLLCTMYSVQCTLYNVHCTMYSVQCTLNNVHCTVYTVPRRYWIEGGGDRVSVHFAVTFLDCCRTSFCTVQCTLYTVKCTLYSVIIIFSVLAGLLYISCIPKKFFLLEYNWNIEMKVSHGYSYILTTRSKKHALEL